MKYLPLLLVLAILAGCDSSSSDTTLTATVLEGYVELKDSLGNKLTDHSGVRVSILGTGQSTSTTQDGQWNIPGYPADKPFTLVFTKQGFAEERHENYEPKASIGGNIAFGLKRLYAIQTFHPSMVVRGFEDIHGGSEPKPSYKAVFSVRIPEFDTRLASAYCMVFFSKANAIDAANPGSYTYSTQLRLTSNLDGAAYFDIYADSLYKSGFKAGDKIYCQGYAAGYFCGPSHYTDPLTQKAIYTGFSPVHSPATSFTAP